MITLLVSADMVLPCITRFLLSVKQFYKNNETQICLKIKNKLCNCKFLLKNNTMLQESLEDFLGKTAF